MNQVQQEVQADVRVFGFDVAQELTEAELEMIAGAGTSYCCGCTADDCKPY
jgi:hypothetical protein